MKIRFRSKSRNRLAGFILAVTAGALFAPPLAQAQWYYLEDSLDYTFRFDQLMKPWV